MIPTVIAQAALPGAAFPMWVADTLLTATRDEPEAAFDMINVWSHAPSIQPFAARPGCPAPGFNVVWQNLRLMQRINVALSRARTMLIIVGDTATLRGSYFDRIVRYIRANGMLVPGPRSAWAPRGGDGTCRDRFQRETSIT